MPRSIQQILSACPWPIEKRIALHVSAEAERQLRQGHPWLYDQAIRKQSHEGQSGDLAVVFDSRNRFLAVGLYDPDSPIRVRILQSRKPTPITREWFEARLHEAIARRETLSTSRTTGYRLVHGENDGLPALVIDRYDKTLVMKLYTAAWVPHLRDVMDALEAVFDGERVVLRLSRALQEKPARLHGLADGMVVAGLPVHGPVLFEENALRFEVDVVHGQKTGFFLDQRENRARVERLSKGRSVLDAFAYTGACSVYAARGRARDITSVDLSRAALETAKRNLALNRHHASVAAVSHRTIVGDTFEILETLRKKRKVFDLVILDPPAFAKTQREVPAALAAYERLARAGFLVLRPGGILVASSCSSHVPAEAFFTTLYHAAVRTGRTLKELERTGHPLDHPIRFREGAYLKCLFTIALAK